MLQGALTYSLLQGALTYSLLQGALTYSLLQGALTSLHTRWACFHCVVSTVLFPLCCFYCVAAYVQCSEHIEFEEISSGLFLECSGGIERMYLLDSRKMLFT